MPFGYPDFADRLQGHHPDPEAAEFIERAIRRGIELGFVKCRSAIRDDPGGARTHLVECYLSSSPFPEQFLFDEPAHRGEPE